MGKRKGRKRQQGKNKWKPFDPNVSENILTEKFELFYTPEEKEIGDFRRKPTQEHFLAWEKEFGTGGLKSLWNALRRNPPGSGRTTSQPQQIKRQARPQHQQQVVVKKNRTDEEWRAFLERYPIADDGFALAVEWNDPQLDDLLEKYGFAVIANVLTPDECRETIEAIKDDAERNSQNGLRLDENDPNTWENATFGSRGKYVFSAPTIHPIALRNLANQKIYNLYTRLYGTEKLNVSLDRFGVSRGTRNVFINGRYQDRDDWACWLDPHWDINCFRWVQNLNEGIKCTYQGALNLKDTPYGCGGHYQIPGSSKYLEEWITFKNSEKYADRVSMRPNKTDPVSNYKQEVPLRAGDYVIWKQSNLHGALRNNSNELRLVQYIRMYPAEPFYRNQDTMDAQNQINRWGFRPTQFGRLTNLQMRLLQFSDWPENDDDEYTN